MTAAQTAAVLVGHQGPFFNGVDERCSCGHLVRSGQEWAQHVARQLSGNQPDLADPNDPAVTAALQTTCGLCHAKPGDRCTTLTNGHDLRDIVHRYRVDPTHTK